MAVYLKCTWISWILEEATDTPFNSEWKQMNVWESESTKSHILSNPQSDFFYYYYFKLSRNTHFVIVIVTLLSEKPTKSTMTLIVVIWRGNKWNFHAIVIHLEILVLFYDAMKLFLHIENGYSKLLCLSKCWTKLFSNSMISLWYRKIRWNIV